MHAAKAAKWIVLILFISLLANVLVFSLADAGIPDFSDMFAVAAAFVFLAFIHELRHR